MQHKTIVETFDHVYHDSVDDAIKHLNRLESDQVFKVVEIVAQNCQGRTKTTDFIGENHLLLFRALQHLDNIRNDFTLTCED